MATYTADVGHRLGVAAGVSPANLSVGDTVSVTGTILSPRVALGDDTLFTTSIVSGSGPLDLDSRIKIKSQVVGIQLNDIGIIYTGPVYAETPLTVVSSVTVTATRSVSGADTITVSHTVIAELRAVNYPLITLDRAIRFPAIKYTLGWDALTYDGWKTFTYDGWNKLAMRYTVLQIGTSIYDGDRLAGVVARMGGQLKVEAYFNGTWIPYILTL